MQGRACPMATIPFRREHLDELLPPCHQRREIGLRVVG